MKAIKKFCMTRKFWTIIAVVLAAAVSSPLALVKPWLLIVPFLALAGMFIYNALKNIPAQPASKGVLTFFGKRLEVVLDEGWRYFPFYPFVFGFILVKVEKVNYDLDPQEVRTPDRALISVSASITWKAGIEGDRKSYISYLNSGGEEGVKKIIRDVIEDRVKTWATSNREGPSNWMEAQALKDDAHEVLVKSLLGGTLPEIGSAIPTNTWMRFFDIPQSEPTRYDTASRPGENPWANKDEATGKWNWNGLQSIYDGYSSSEKAELVRKVLQRRQAVRRIREGKGEFGDESLGITIVRFTVNDVKVQGSVAEAADLEEKERREREADKMEIENISDRAKRLKEDHSDLTSEQAFKLVQVERGKATRTIIDVTGAKTDVGNDLLGLAGVAREIIKEFRGDGNPGGQGGGNPSAFPPARLEELERLAQRGSPPANK